MKKKRIIGTAILLSMLMATPISVYAKDDDDSEKKLKAKSSIDFCSYSVEVELDSKKNDDIIEISIDDITGDINDTTSSIIETKEEEIKKEKEEKKAKAEAAQTNTDNSDTSSGSDSSSNSDSDSSSSSDPDTSYYSEPSTWDGTVLTKSAGVNYGPSGKETYYNLDMSGVVSIMRGMGFDEENYPYWVRDDGAKMLGPYIMVAANLDVHPRGTTVQCSMGTALVCDTGGFAASNPYQLDIATTW